MHLSFPILLISVGGCPADGFSHLEKSKFSRNVLFLSLGEPQDI
jgi:hypothetical protein